MSLHLVVGAGPVSTALAEQLLADGEQVRVVTRHDALDAHNAGRVRAFEVRGSDYLGGNSLAAAVVTPAMRKGRRAYVPADLDAPHTWTDVREVARILAVGVRDERAWGRPWHVPSAEPATIRELAVIMAGQLGAAAKVSAMPYAALWTYGLFNSIGKELPETQYQFRKPFVLDSSAAQQTFGMAGRPLAESVAFDLANTPS